MPGFSGGVGSSVGGAAGDNGSRGGGAGTSKSWNPNKPGQVESYNGQSINVRGGWDTVSDSKNRNGGGSGSTGSGGGSGGNQTTQSMSTQELQTLINNNTKNLANWKGNATQRAVQEAFLTSLQKELQGRSSAAATPAQAGAPAAGAQNAQQAAQQAAAAQQQAEQQRAAQAAAEAARVAEEQRQQRITAENATREQLTAQLGKTTSAKDTQAILDQIGKLGAEADNAAAINKQLSESARQRFDQQTEQAKNNAIGQAQTDAGTAVADRIDVSREAGTNTAAVSSSYGTAISDADQKANAEEAARMGGYSDRDESTSARVGRVAKATLSGLGAAGPAGAVLGGAAAVYSNFISDRQSASSRALTAGTPGSRPTVGDALAGMGSGALAGSVLGPIGAIGGAIWGGMTATGTAPTAEDLKGINPNPSGVTAGGLGPGQTLVNGQFVGNGNGGGNGKGQSSSGSTGAGMSPGGATTSPGAGGGSNAAPNGNSTGSNSNAGQSQIDDRNKAGQSAFNNFLDELRKRQMDNLLYTGAGWNKTSGTSLLGRVGAAQGAVGGMTGQTISQYGGGKSLLGGAWSF